MNNLQNILVTKRKELKLSLREAGDLIGISHSYLSTLEKGFDPRTGAPIKPTPETLKLISKAYNIKYEVLMSIAGYIEKDIDNKIIKGTPEQDIVPEEFTNADEARAYVNKHQIFGAGGFDADRLDDDEILEFANALLEQMKMVSYKYKK